MGEPGASGSRGSFLRGPIPTKEARLIGTWAVLVSAGLLPAQDVIVIGDTPSCRDYRIRLEHVATIGSSTEPDLLSMTAGVRMDRNGNVLVADAQSYPGQLLYRPAGSTEWKVFGGKGEGPGEFEFAGNIWISSQGLHVADLGTGRETVYDRDGEFVATFRLPAPPDYVIEVEDGRQVHASVVRTPSAAGYPLHLLDSEREVVSSFGADTALLLPGHSVLARRAVARAGDGAIWSARVNEYRIEKWSPSGRKILTIQRDADWFEPWVEPTNHLVSRAPPFVVSIAEDDGGRIWVMMYVADRNFEPQVGPDDHIPITEEMRHRARDTVVEVLDPRAGTVLARARNDRVLWPHVGHMLVGQKHEALDGSLRFGVYRLRLVTPTRR